MARIVLVKHGNHSVCSHISTIGNSNLFEVFKVASAVDVVAASKNEVNVACRFNGSNQCRNVCRIFFNAPCNVKRTYVNFVLGKVCGKVCFKFFQLFGAYPRTVGFVPYGNNQCLVGDYYVAGVGRRIGIGYYRRICHVVILGCAAFACVSGQNPLVNLVYNFVVAEFCGVTRFACACQLDVAVVLQEVNATVHAARAFNIACRSPSDHDVDVAVVHNCSASGTDVTCVTAHHDVHAVGCVALCCQKCFKRGQKFVHYALIETGCLFLVVPSNGDVVTRLHAKHCIQRNFTVNGVVLYVVVTDKTFILRQRHVGDVLVLPVLVCRPAQKYITFGCFGNGNDGIVERVDDVVAVQRVSVDVQRNVYVVFQPCHNRARRKRQQTHNRNK